MKTEILIATRSFGSASPKPFDVLTEAGFHYTPADMSQEMTEGRLIELLEGISGAIVGVVPMTAHVLENAPGLRVVSMHGIGVDHIDLNAAERLGVVVANCPGTNDQAVADLTIGLMIAVARNLPRVDAAVRRGDWRRFEGGELWRKTLGLIGLGRIGQAVAKRAIGFEMRVLVYDPYIRINQHQQFNRLEFLGFNEVIARADFLSLHAPLTAETRHMISETQLQAMKPSAYLINTARGDLVDEQALYHALCGKQIAGAAIDVFVEEPPTGSPLLNLENVVLTPHTGAHTKEAIERMGIMAAQNVVRTLQGGQPLNRVV
ncbi:MAG: phosphoglycerate dehydrogenase [Anaerolineales bacterium]|nr:phosphoglycerate dehydrogenase [Anaerolineales bacterium]